ncbi:MAG: Rnase Y domain-containing protein, partial [Patescibacteria group bacterium]
MENGISSPLFLAGALVAGAVIGYFVRRSIGLKAAGSVERKITRRLEEAEKRSKEIVLEAETKSAAVLSEAKKLERERQAQLTNLENRLVSREETLEKRASTFADEEARFKAKQESVARASEEVENLKKKAEERLQATSGLSREAAREELFRELKENARQDLAATLQKINQERRDELEKKSVEIMTTALQRYARSHVSELTTPVFPLA